MARMPRYPHRIGGGFLPSSRRLGGGFLPSSRRQRLFPEWTKWLLVILIPFSALCFDTWLNTQMLKRDYELSEISRRERELHQILDGVSDEKATLETMAHSEITAPDVGLINPQPGQIQIVYFANPDAATADESASYRLASQPQPGNDPALDLKALVARVWRSREGGDDGIPAQNPIRFSRSH